MTAFYGQNPAGRALENSLFLLLNLIASISIFYWTVRSFGVIYNIYRCDNSNNNNINNKRR
jgi:hypothetical protein